MAEKEFITKLAARTAIENYACRDCVHSNGKKCEDCEYQDCIDFINEVEAANVQPVDRWISTKDRLPDVGQPVLIYYPCWDGTEVQAARLEYDKLFFEICGEFNASVNKVTHWQPLPVPPKD